MLHGTTQYEGGSWSGGSSKMYLHDPVIDVAKVHLFTMARSMTRPPTRLLLLAIELLEKYLPDTLWPMASLVFQFLLLQQPSQNVRQDVAFEFPGCQCRGSCQCGSPQFRSDQERTAQRWNKGELYFSHFSHLCSEMYLIINYPCLHIIFLAEYSVTRMQTMYGGKSLRGT